MNRARLMPDEIHDFAPNIEWLGWLAAASFKIGKPANGPRTRRSRQRRRIALRSELLDLADAESEPEPSESESEQAESAENESADEESANDPQSVRTAKSIRDQMTRLRRVIARASAAAASHRKDPANVNEPA